MNEKMRDLQDILVALGSFSLAFSGGVDSTFLLALAQSLPDVRVVAVTARSCVFPQRELDEAIVFCAERNIEHIIVDTDELNIPGFVQNPPNRCYLCKTELLAKIKAVACECGLAHVVEGSNADDVGDYRPGMQAVAELGVRSPLREAGWTKDEIRAASKAMGLPTAEKPSLACLASRICYGNEITLEKLQRIERAEQLLLERGLTQVRVRAHDDLARIEVDEQSIARLFGNDGGVLRREIDNALHDLGFAYISADLRGYRTGSMNEMLGERK